MKEVEVNQEAIEQLSIADMLALISWYRNSKSWNKFNLVMKELSKREKNIFIF